MQQIQSNILVCPYCKMTLKENSHKLFCSKCNTIYKIIDEIPDFLSNKARLEKKEMITFVDRLSSIYESPFWYPVVYYFYGGFFVPSIKKTIRLVTDMLHISGGKALDVACGTGLYTRSIARRAKIAYGFDISMGMLKKAVKYAKKNKLTGIKFIRADVENIPFPDEYFGGCSCCGALHLFPNLVGALNEMNRILKRGGKLAVMTFVKRRLFGIKAIWKHIEKDHHAHIFDVKELEKLLDITGFDNFKHKIFSSMILFEAKKSGK